MSERLLAAFPGLRLAPFRITSPADPSYNCIAWASGDFTDWWWPLADARKTLWPDGVPRELSLDALRAAFVSLGYNVCDSDILEPTHEKVAIFASARVMAGTP